MSTEGIPAMNPQTTSRDERSAYEIVNAVGGVMLERDDPADVCFTGRQNIGSKIGLPKVARKFASVAAAQAFCAQHKVRNVRIVECMS